MKDTDIVSLYWNRNEDAIKETTQKYGTYLTKIAMNILYDYQDSEECVNDTYLRTWNSIPMKKPTYLSCFLAKITRYLAVDQYRKKYAQKRYASEYAVSLSELGDVFASGSTPEQELHKEALHDAIDVFLRRLSPTARNVFVGRYFFFDSTKYIAAYCGIAEGTVKSSLHRTRQALKEYLIKEGFDV